MDATHASPGQNSSSAGTAHSRFSKVRALNADIMREQMEYLLSHRKKSCCPGCPDCARLEQVKRCLFLPFR